mgnify:CR=1 FL=1
MMDLLLPNLVMLFAALGFSLLASYYDLKTGEIPDKFTLGLVVTALALRAGFSLYISDFTYLLDGILVGGIFFGFGAALFYTGGWGGGDTKLIAGIGAALGGLVAPSIIDSSFTIFPAFFGMLVALSMVAIAYSMAYALLLSFKSPKVFRLTYGRLKEGWFLFAIVCVASVAMLVVLKPYTTLLTLALMSPPVFYMLILFVRAVEEIAMQKEVDVKDLREGDMVVQDLVADGKRIISKRDMDGISKEALEKLGKAKKKPKKVMIKWGIKFAPAFPLAIIVSPFWTKILLLFIGSCF